MTRVSRSTRYAFILLAGMFPHAFSQPSDLVFENLSTSQGLSHLVTTSIAQDSSGFLWIGTMDGLNRYDGFQFTVYKSVTKDSTTLSRNEVRCLFVDRSGTLWVGTAYGLNRYDPIGKRFKRILTEKKKANTLVDSHINVIMQDASGILWLGTTGGLSGFNEATNTFLNFKTDPGNENSLSDNNVMSIGEDEDGTLWIGTHKGLNRLSKDRKKFKRYLYDPHNPNSLRQETVSAIHLDGTGLLWIGTLDGLDVFDRRNDPLLLATLSLPGFNHSNVLDIMGDKFGNIWLATFGGGLNMVTSANADSLRRRLTKALRVVQYRNAPLNTRSLHNDFIHALFEDASGALWACTNNGLSKSDNEGARFRILQRDPRNPHGLSANLVTTICEGSNGTIWIGTSDNLNNIPPGSTEVRYTILGRNGPPDLTEISSVYEDTRGILWIATWKGLSRFDPHSNTLTRFRNNQNDPSSISGDAVVSIGEDRTGTMWFGTYGSGLNSFNRDTQSFTHYYHDPADSLSLSNNTIYSIFRDRSGRMWFGTRDGLNYLDSTSGRFERFHHEEGRQGFRSQATR
ncbi:MAG: two-component regulator propeller domain-containing protein [Bacteroidota bacterium]